MRFILTIILFFTEISFAKPVNGIFVLWQRKPCLPNSTCEMPQPLSNPQSFEFSSFDGSAPGTYPAPSVTRSLNGFKIHLEFYTVNKGPTPYYVSQEFILDEFNAVVAQCTQYSEAKVTFFFPVGSCSGIHKEKQIGISFLKPGPSDK